MKLGVTGGIASGKSTVTRLFGGLGAVTIDADEIARTITAPGTSTTLAVLQEFGSGYATRDNPAAIDRSKLADAVFSDASLRMKLESITHPAIISELSLRLSEAQINNNSLLVVAEVPLLIEAHLDYLFDRTVLVWCSRATQLKRLKTRLPSMDETSLSQRVDAQLPLDDKRTRCDIVINSEGNLAQLSQDVEQVYRRIVTGKH